MSSIKIESGAGWAKVFVEGQQLRHLTGLAVDFTDRHAPKVGVTMHMTESCIDLTGATLRIDGVEVTKALEDALLEYLCRKRPLEAKFFRAAAGVFPAQPIPSDPRPIEQL